MKFSKFSSAVLGATLLLSSAAFAGTGKGKLHLAETLTVDGKQLKPGDYNLEWTGDGADTKLNIIKGRDTVASVPARVNADGTKQRDGYGSTTQADGSKTLTSVFANGKLIQIGQQDAATATPAR